MARSQTNKPPQEKCRAYGWSGGHLSREGGDVIERRVLAAGHGALELEPGAACRMGCGWFWAGKD